MKSKRLPKSERLQEPPDTDFKGKCDNIISLRFILPKNKKNHITLAYLSFIDTIQK